MAVIYQYLLHNVVKSPDDITIFGSNHHEKKDVDVNDWIRKYSNVIMTDISLSIDQMKKLYKKLGNNFLWFDHHAPVIREAAENGLSEIIGKRETDRSAIMCAYDYFYNPFNLDLRLNPNETRCPLLLLVLSAYDSFTFDNWGFRKDYASNVNTGVVNTFNLQAEDIIHYVDYYMNGFQNLSDFNQFNDKEIEKFRQNGEQFDKAYYQRIANTIRDWGFEVTVDGNRKALAVVCSSLVGSQCFQTVKDEYPSGVIFKRGKNGVWTISLYNTDEKDKSFHCGEYVKKKYGGGGHLGAAGCEVPESTVMKIFKTNKL